MLARKTKGGKNFDFGGECGMEIEIQILYI